jgi:hypothetical protein
MVGYSQDGDSRFHQHVDAYAPNKGALLKIEGPEPFGTQFQLERNGYTPIIVHVKLTWHNL